MRGVFDEEDLEPARHRRDTELTLGSGTLLAIFFALVLLCGLCFGLGYAMGHRSAQSTVASASGADASQPSTAGSQAKPSAAAESAVTPPADTGTAPSAIDPSQSPAAPADGVSGAPPQPFASPSNAMQSQGGGQLQVHPALTPGTASAQTMQPAASGAVRPALAPASSSPAASFMVQIAAVSNQEDADVLTVALRKRGYTVTEQREPIDNLIHVRIGPFGSPAEASSWKNRLLNDGYNAIVQQ